MSIDPEQLLKLAKDRHGPAGVTLGWPMVINIVDELRRLQRLQEALDESMELHREACAQDGEWPQELAFAAEVWMERKQSEEAPCSSTSPSASPSASC